jgi:hypothetical protein
VFDYGVTKVPLKAKDKLADLVIKRYQEAAAWQSSERVGGKSLRTVLSDCYSQANNILPAEDREAAKALGVEGHVGLTAMKGGVVQAFLMESLVSADGLPWTIKPTPIPDLSKRGRLEVLRLVKEEWFNGLNPDVNILDLMRDIKQKFKLEEEKSAETAALRMEKLMYDQCAEGSWRQAMSGFLYHFVFYPFGVIQGPVPIRKPRLAWSGDSVRVKSEIFYKWESISPWDFWYSPDSRNTQEGTGIFVRKRMTRRQLLEMREMRSYLGDQVDKLLDDIETDEGFVFRWLSENPDQPDNRLSSWYNCVATVDSLTHYGLVSGDELAEYGLTGLEAKKFYDATITIIGGYTVQVFIAPDPTVNIRPVFTASFYRTRDRIPNFGIAQRLRDIERAYMTAMRYLIRNMANASEPRIEADYARLSKYNDEDALLRFDPGSVFFTENDPINAAIPAIRYGAVPSAVGDFARVMEYFMEMGHMITNIPAALHGTAVGTGANRTFRGMANLQANAVKSLEAAVGNIDETVFLPMGELLYGYNMLYEDDMSIKGDSKVMAQGVMGLLAREMERDNALELLQLIGSIGAQLGDSASPLVDWALQRALISMRVPADLASKVKFGVPEGPPPQAEIPPEALAAEGLGDAGGQIPAAVASTPSPPAAGPPVPPGPLM